MHPLAPALTRAHSKINPVEANPNEYITFIRALPRFKDHADAEHILKAVAAQTKRIFRDRFMLVGTLEEAGYNRVFAGRNWNHGQSIELVLRRADGRFLPLKYIMGVMCHEMAHITHMNHGPEFQKLNAAIKRDVAELQAKGHYGDGFWSDGLRLSDRARLGAEGLKEDDFPEYICGVSAGDARKARGGRRAGRGPASSRAPGLVQGEASHRSGRQTDYNRKPARRTNVDMGEGGSRLDGLQAITKEERETRKAAVDRRAKRLQKQGLSLAKAKKLAAEEYDRANPWFKEGSSYGKRAKSKTAAELRAEAAERRLAALAGPPRNGGAGVKEDPDELDELDELEDEERDFKPDISDDDDDVILIEDPHLSIEDRKAELESEMTEAERDMLRGGWDEFVETAAATSASKRKSPPEADARANKKTAGSSSTLPHSRKSNSATATSFDHASIVRQARLQAVGLAATTSLHTSHRLGGAGTDEGHGSNPGRPIKQEITTEWHCAMCTFINGVGSRRCEMCDSLPADEE
ncbi:DNA-dependent metalloprotease WSS1 [Vanrija pseudolonga]|uniref:DNA-dependent metalloprotease WSS1 n=1 Tax=Vanrija pseudolonga TaxID=143232 RepID=A0AAF0YF94_9TREE|nr:DNA-dependent metalloprotease WSS1 [Vanrija pseudolonga]